MQSTSLNNSNAAEAGSPNWVIKWCTFFSDRVFDFAFKLLSPGRRLDYLSLCIFIAILSYYFLNFSNIEIETRNDFYVLTIFRWAPIILTVCTIFTFLKIFFAQLNIRTYLLLAILTLLGKGYWHLAVNAPIVFAIDTGLNLLTFLLLGILTYHAKKTNQNVKFLYVAIGFCFLLFLRFLIPMFSPDRANLHRALFTPERLILPISIFWAEGTRIKNPRSMFTKERFFQLFLPFNILTPLPVSYEQLQPTHGDKLKQVRLQGLFDFATGAIQLYIYMTLRQFEKVEMTYAPLDISLLGAFYYLELFLKSSLLFRAVTGFARSIGFDLYDGFNFALLATSPMDRWTRWSIYYNRWLRDFIFFPLMVKTRQYFWPLIFTFFISFWLHSFSHFLRFGADHLYPSNLFMWRSKLVYYVLQVFVLYFSLKCSKFWPDGNSLRGWWGVLTTFWLMAGIHVFVYAAL